MRGEVETVEKREAERLRRHQDQLQEPKLQLEVEEQLDSMAVPWFCLACGLYYCLCKTTLSPL